MTEMPQIPITANHSRGLIFYKIQYVTFSETNKFVISGLAVQIRPWAPIKNQRG
jgi:hypothetical protein